MHKITKIVLSQTDNDSISLVVVDTDEQGYELIFDPVLGVFEEAFQVDGSDVPIVFTIISLEHVPPHIRIKCKKLIKLLYDLPQQFSSSY